MYKALVKSDFNKAAANYDQNADLQRDVAKRLLAMSEVNFGSAVNLLDIGCGTGFLTRAVPKTWNVTQLDIALSMCQLAKGYSNVINADMEMMPLNSSSFDGAISSLAVQWSDNPCSLFAEVNRVLKENGKFIFSTIGPNTLKELKTAFNDTIDSAHVSSFLDKRTLQAIINNAGFMELDFYQKQIKIDYPDVLSLMQKIKSIGGSNKSDDRREIFSKTSLAKLNHRYRVEHKSEQGIEATWEIFYVICQKI